MKPCASGVVIQQASAANKNPECLHDAKAIRRTVFIEEQGVAEKEEWDQYDSDHHTLHFTAYYKSNAVACGRVIKNKLCLQLGRLAVIQPMRGNGIGEILFRHMLISCLRIRDCQLMLNSQKSVISWYQRFGFETSGSEFIDAGIIHQKMIWKKNCNLDVIYKDNVVRTENMHECAAHTINLLSSSNYTIDIFSDDLTSGLFRQPEVVSLISSIARRDKKSLVRILLRDSCFLAKKDHPLVNLQQKIPSKFQIRVVTAEPKHDAASYLSADNMRLLYMDNEREGLGFINFSARAEIKHIMLEYNDLWSRYSRTDPNLSALFI